MQRPLTCPRAPRRSPAAAAKLYCQLCWRPLVDASRGGRPQAHPCLFCPQCARESARQPEPHSALRASPDNRHTGQSQLPTQATTGSAPWQGQGRSRRTHPDVDEPDPLTSRAGPIIYRTVLSKRERSLFRSKLHELDTKAIRCGFCPREARHQKLVSYCCFCTKHLCRRCDLTHGADPLYKHHPTVRLTTGINKALQ